jgi:uncharacterized membrane protein YhaH (DUF805 family)
MLNWYLKCLRKYAVLSGRAHRMEYWSFVLINVSICLALQVVSAVGPTGSGILSLLYGLAVFIPGCAVTVRRLQDAGKSGRWLYILVIPIIGSVVILTFLVRKSQLGKNQYGPNQSEENR